MATQYSMHTVGVGDTIQSIGDLYGVPWTDLVVINGLEYPYIDDTLIDNDYKFVDTVAKVGSKLLIPSTGIVVPVKTNNTSSEIEKYAFGCDLDLFSSEKTINGVINLENEGQLTDDNKGDIKLSEGIENLRQQLVLRLGTPKGALLLHPEFGSNLLDFIGKKVTLEVLTDVKLEIQECLLGDFRVNGISDIEVAFKSGGIRVECVIHPIEPYSSPFLLGHTYYE